MSDDSKRTGLWFIGARGSVATTATAGLLALQAGLIEPLGCVTEQAPLAEAGLPGWDELVVGGHDIATVPLDKRAEALAESGVLPPRVLAAVRDGLREVDSQIRQGYSSSPGTESTPSERSEAQRSEAPRAEAPRSETQPPESQRQVADRLIGDLHAFRAKHDLARVVVINVSSTEPPVPDCPEHAELALLEAALDDPARAVLPPSSLAAYAALRAGCAFVDFTPSTGIALPALAELARQAGLPYAGRDGKTGETLLRTVLAPMFTARALKVRAWAGTNLLGGGDGATLQDAANASSKLESKARGLAQLLGEPVCAPLHIDNVPSLGEQKTAWDHVAFDGFLGARMTLQFTWTGLDSALAAPLVLDLGRLMSAALSAGRSGPQAELAFFFKDPMVPDGAVVEHRFAEQTARLHAWALGLGR